MDTSNAIHPDCNNHTGATISLGWRLVSSMSKRQKINPRSSTEVELIKDDGVLPEFLWSRYSIEAKGFKVKEAVMHQDNLSAMLL